MGDSRARQELQEDTKVDLELSGEIDSSQEKNSPGKSSLLGGMSLPVPINISQPAVKEWFGKRRANIRPFGVFFNTSNFQAPPSAGRLTKRLYKNVEFPVQLCDGVHSAGPLLPPHLPPPADSHSSLWRRRLHCCPQEC